MCMSVVLSTSVDICVIVLFFFSSRRRHTRYWRDWSSDVCSSDLQRLIGDTFPGQLALEVLVPIEAQLGVVRKVGAELEEERAELAINAVEVILIDQGGGAHQPRVGLAGGGMAPALGAEDRRFLLGLADEQHALLAREGGAVSSGEIILALPLGEGDERDALLLGKALNGGHERPADRLHQGCGGDRLAPVLPEEADHAQLPLQLGHVDIEVQPVDAL